MSRSFATLLLLIVAVILPCTAQAGLFDQLFGGGSSGSIFGEPSIPVYRNQNQPPRHRAHHPQKLVEQKPTVQQPTDLMHDRTLHVGDAVMTNSGIKIFTGERQSSHDDDDFTPLEQAKHVNPHEKLVLAEINAARTGGVLETKPSNAPVTGRSAAVSSPIVNGVEIKDRAGRSIRFVGP